MTSEATSRARVFVAAHRDAARQLGRRVAALVDDPETFVSELEAGLTALADPEYREAQAVVAPGAGPLLGVRRPLLDAVASPLRRSLAARSPAVSVYLADRLARAELHETRGFALPAVRRALPADPERSWQLIRRLARGASDWITVDSLADVAALGILLEPYRWAELEQLVYSPHRWERRLVASTIARLPFALPGPRRGELSTAPALTIIESVIGDAEPEVQKALSWALRSWREVDAHGVERVLRGQAERAAREHDGHRAWVIRDALAPRPPRYAAELRKLLEGVRRRDDAPSTSTASEVSRSFRGFLDLAPAPGEAVDRGGTYLSDEPRRGAAATASRGTAA